MFKKRDHYLTEAICRLSESICHLTKAVLLKVDQDNAGHRPPRIRLEWAFGLARNKATEGYNMTETTITNEQEVVATLNIKTDTGRPAKVDGKPVWEVLTGTSTITVADDGFSATLTSSDEAGDTDYIVKADANLGEGVEEISDIVRLHVTSATAKNLGLSLGEPTAKA